MWVGKCFGKPALEAIKQEAVICSGSTLGTAWGWSVFCWVVVAAYSVLYCWCLYVVVVVKPCTVRVSLDWNVQTTKLIASYNYFSSRVTGSYLAVSYYVRTMLASMDTVKCWLKGMPGVLCVLNVLVVFVWLLMRDYVIWCSPVDYWCGLFSVSSLHRHRVRPRLPVAPLLQRKV